MNIRILGDAIAVQRQNDEKVVNFVRAKAQREWDKCETMSTITKTNFGQISFKATIAIVRS
jgi:di/tripeptidase